MKKEYWITLASISFLILVVVTRSNDIEPSKKENKDALPIISVVEVDAEEYSAEIESKGFALARKSLTLKSEVSGLVIDISDNLHQGERIKKGDILFRLDRSRYEESVANARSNLAEAEVNYLNHKLNYDLALDSKSAISGNDQALLRAAEEKVEYQKAVLKRSLLELKKTTVRSPFNAYIVNKEIEVGSYLSSGANAVEIIGTDEFELKLPLSKSQWNLLNTDIENNKVTLKNLDESFEWSGVIALQELHIDEHSRQRRLSIIVNNPFDQPHPIYAGSYLKAVISGKKISNLWKIPISSISQNNEIWFLSDMGELNKEKANVVFTKADFAYVVPFEGLNKVKIVIYPLNSYLPGMRAIAKEHG